MPIEASTELMDLLRRCRLLDEEQLTSITEKERTLPACDLARPLMHRGWLTPYQVNELFLGRGMDLVLGSYVLLEKVGEGGMGTVFKARNWKLGRIVALKLIRKDRLASSMAVQRFQREIRAAAQLQHPHIVKAIDAGAVGDVNFFVMEYVPGDSLTQVVRKAGPLPVRQACEYIRQAALGLQHAFERGLVHRDIKPSNLLLAVDGTVKILDMGLARCDDLEEDETSTITREGAVMGTPDYMSPEQSLESHSADIRSDLYSLGCSAYFLLTGRVPFPGGSVTEKLMRHQLREPERIERIRPEIPAALGDLIRTLMAKQPQQRHQTPQALVDALDGIVAQWEGHPSGTPAEESIAPGGESTVELSTPIELHDATLPAMRAVMQQAQETSQTRKNLVPGGGIVVSAASLLILSIVFFRYWQSNSIRKNDPVASASPIEKKKDTFFPLDPEKKFVPEPVKRLEAAGPVTEAWTKEVQKLPAPDQAAAVLAKLKALNEGFDDKHPSNKVGMEKGWVHSLELSQVLTDISPLQALKGLERLSLVAGPYAHDHPQPLVSLADLGPLRGLKLRDLNLQGNRLGNLLPLEEMPLESLVVSRSLVEDLTPLAKCRSLTRLDLFGTNVKDLSPLRKMKLKMLNIEHSRVADMSQLQGMPLEELHLPSQITSLEFLRGMPLVRLKLHTSKVTDLSPLTGMKTLRYLDLTNTKVADLTPLKSTSVEEVLLTEVPERDKLLLQSIPTFRKINSKRHGVTAK